MYKTLNDKISQNKFAVGILGLGYVGLPLAKQFCLNKVKVFGIDIDKKKISNLKKNISYIKTIQNKDIVLMNKNKFMPTTNFSIVKKCDVLIFCLPTPLDKHQNPDMSYITNTLEATKFFFKKGQLFILESTTYPGTTEEFFLPIF
jgi:UDP-N-acetyl-D-glucosamine dehydrogenase